MANGDTAPGADSAGELKRLQRRCEELEFLIEQYRAQADGWREITQVVWVLFAGHRGSIFIYDLGPDGLPDSLVVANDTACRLLGFSREELLGLPPEFLCEPAHLDRLHRSLEEVRSEGNTAVEVDLVARDGLRIPMELSLSYYTYRDSRRVLSIGRDVRERKQAEEDLRDSQERYRVLVENINDVLFTVDVGGCVTYISPVVERVSGWKTEEIIGKSLSSFMHPEEYEALIAGLAFSQDGTQEPREFRVIDKDGGLRYVRTSGRLIMEEGEPVGISGNMVDITREKAYERTLEESARRLRDFLSVASHELRHPITIIKGYAQLLASAEGEIPREKAQAIFSSIERNIDHLNRLGDELLDVSRIEEERFTIRRRIVDPARLVREVVDDMRVRGYRNEPAVDIDAGLGKIKVDREKVKRLLIILMENALKYAPASPPVEVEAGREGTEVVFSVLDRGPGIPAGEEERIFERFYQVDDVFHHSKPGIGLGLYIGREIAGAHGGRIWYETRPGGGSIFRFSLPQE